MRWDFGDGSPAASGETASHVFSESGQFLVTLSVVDSQGASSTFQILIFVHPEHCPGFEPGTSNGAVEADEVIEASGIAASRKNAGVLWVHNDSGDSPRLFAMNAQRKHLGVYRILNASALDWEDIAAGPGPVEGEDYLYIADIGDNARARSHVVIYRVIEPSVSLRQTAATFDVPGAARLEMNYPGGAAHDAESLLADPVSGDLYIVTKRGDGRSEVYRKPAPHAEGARATMEFAASLSFGLGPLPGSTLVTAGDISPLGNSIILKTHSHAFLWRRPAGSAIEEAFAGEPCPLPARSEPQGEAIGFGADGLGYFTLSEGPHPPLYFFPRNQ
ncbi:MAG: PKD domain-containing protein [Planctomycetes bacterium]|nr:PKD domain-containing protein [Planctomycetota bacterium]